MHAIHVTLSQIAMLNRELHLKNITVTKLGAYTGPTSTA